jgi:hypothetical protein
MRIKLLRVVGISVCAISVIVGSASSAILSLKRTKLIPLSLHDCIPVKTPARYAESLSYILRDRNAQDVWGNTVLHRVLNNLDDQYSIKLASLLLQHGASIDIPNGLGLTARQLAQRRKRELLEDKQLHESDPLHGQLQEVARIDRHIAAIQIIFEGMAPVPPKFQVRGRRSPKRPAPSVELCSSTMPCDQ